MDSSRTNFIFILHYLTRHLSAEVKKEYGYTSTPPLGLHGLLWEHLYLYLYLTRQGCIIFVPSIYVSINQVISD
jgi:hypothetical protein